jgi:hypothetical protein
MSSNQIPGVPEGWEAVSFDYVSDGEHWLDKGGDPMQHTSSVRTQCKRLIIRKIEKPAAYRPFKSAEEFKPHRDRWWRYNDDHKESLYPPAAYGQKGHHTQNWKDSFDSKTFDDGTPFGVKIDE